LRRNRRRMHGLRSCLRSRGRRRAGRGGGRLRGGTNRRASCRRSAASAKSLPIIQRTAAVSAKTRHRCLPEVLLSSIYGVGPPHRARNVRSAASAAWSSAG
jgi:hypothetical protein